MIDQNRRFERERAKAWHCKRINVEVDPDNYEYIPEVKRADYYDNDVRQRVATYVRVSTDDVRQTTSFELQKKYYEDFVVKHPNWTLVKIYADEGISGTSLNKREQFLEMISDAKHGKIDMIITKSVSRFARNVVDFIGIVRVLAERNPPVGVFFESEAIFSLNDDSQLALSFQATMAEEESHTRSRSMESSLRMRLDHGVPLTPKLLGYMHDSEGNLVPNPEEAPTVKLAFYMYLYGYSTQQIADAFNALGRKSYLGNINWTSNGIVQILRNERHCGDVLTRKTFTPNYRDHKAKRNCGQRPQSRYRNHHEGIVTRDDYNGQHTIEIVALASGSRETPVWCMIYDDLCYEHEADIFANQMKFAKNLAPYEIFVANIEAQNQDQLMIRDLVESYGMKIAAKPAPGSICAVATLETIYTKYGYQVLSRVLRLIIGTWEGDSNSFSANIMNAVAKLCVVYKDQLNDVMFCEKVGAVSVKQLTRTARERRKGAMGFAEAMILEYNGKKKSNAGKLLMNKLHARDVAAWIEPDEDEDFDDSDAFDNLVLGQFGEDEDTSACEE